MSRYQPYLSYKDSGIEWLGEVPEHWKAKKLKYNLGLQTQKVTISGQIVIALENIESKSGKYIATESFYQGEDVAFKSGDILFGKLRPYLAKVYKCDSNGVAFGDLLTYRPIKDFDSSFAFYSLLSDEFIKIVDSSTYGTKMPRASSEFINEMILATPSYEEQTAIANFLDIQTTKIDTLIAKQQRMIELLGEKRSALISHTVIKGLDSNVKMKDSGVKWLGDVPEHWEIVQSRRLFAERKERAQEGDEQLTASQKYGIISQQEFMELEGRKVVQVITGSEILKRAYENDFVISMRSFQGGLEWCKRVGSMSSAYIALIPIKHVIPQFFVYLFKSKPYIQALQSTSNLVRDGQALRFENFSLVDLVIIPDEEQRAIADYLDVQTAKIDTLIAKARQAIELMKERRTALISAAVTGKIDVRGII